MDTNERQATLRIELPGEETIARLTGAASARLYLRLRHEALEAALAEHGADASRVEAGEPLAFNAAEKALACAKAVQAAFAFLQGPDGLAPVRMTVTATDRAELVSKANNAEIWVTAAAKAALGAAMPQAELPPAPAPVLEHATPATPPAPPMPAPTAEPELREWPGPSEKAMERSGPLPAPAPDPNATVIAPRPEPAGETAPARTAPAYDPNATVVAQPAPPRPSAPPPPSSANETVVAPEPPRASPPPPPAQDVPRIVPRPRNTLTGPGAGSAPAVFPARPAGAAIAERPGNAGPDAQAEQARRQQLFAAGIAGGAVAGAGAAVALQQTSASASPAAGPDVLAGAHGDTAALRPDLDGAHGQDVGDARLGVLNGAHGDDLDDDGGSLFALRPVDDVGEGLKSSASALPDVDAGLDDLDDLGDAVREAFRG